MFGSSVLSAASDRIADQTVAAGEGYFRQLTSRNRGRSEGSGLATDPPSAQDPDTTADCGAADAGDPFAGRAAELDAHLDRLDAEGRRTFARAVNAWLSGPVTERDADHLVEHVRRLAAPATQVTYNNAQANGSYGIAVNNVGTIYQGGEHRPHGG
ncbi:hypothetical protein [Streptomyces sp. NPDC059943]|uniref:hypothetical protein n=1 Tax=Streptomyces sp. NPDC059943 TaxID=3347010 RepID=UPI00364642E9